MIKKVNNFLDSITLYAVLLCVLAMLGLSVLNIVLRQFEVTFLWLDPLVRHLVFVATFLGGAFAVGKQQHIKIDILSRIMEKSQHKWLKKTIRLFVLLMSALASYIVIYSSYHLVQLEFESENIIFLGIHSGYLIGIITAGMGLICTRFILQIIFILNQKEIS